MRWLLWTLGAACTASPPSVDDPDTAVDTDPEGGAQLVLATASDDYAVGALTVVDAGSGMATDLTTLHGDAVVRSSGGSVWAIERLGVDAVRRYDEDWTAPLWQQSTGRASNPHDAARCGDSLVVSRYEQSTLLRLDPATGDELGTVDLAAWADDDGLPEASSLAVLNGHLYVALQRLNRQQGWTSAAGGRLLEVDCATWAVTESWAVGPNPTLAHAPGGLWVLAEDGVWPFDGSAVGEELPGDPDGGWVTSVSWEGEAGAFVARDGDEHRVGCLGVDGSWTRGFVSSRYLVEVAVAQGAAWVAARRGWQQPEVAGALLRVDLATCAAAGEVATRLAPYSVVRR